MVLLSFSFVACHNPRFALRDTVHDLSPGRRCIPGLPLWIASGYDVGRGVHAWAFEAGCDSQSASPGNLHAKDVHLICTATTPVYKNRFHLHQGWSFCIGCRSCRHDRHRIVHSTSYGSSNLLSFESIFRRGSGPDRFPAGLHP